ncbi:MAG: hypothetical protein AAGI71_09775 [Bacteroidota bacterium]
MLRFLSLTAVLSLCLFVAGCDSADPTSALDEPDLEAQPVLTETPSIFQATTRGLYQAELKGTASFSDDAEDGEFAVGLFDVNNRAYTYLFLTLTSEDAEATHLLRLLYIGLDDPAPQVYDIHNAVFIGAGELDGQYLAFLERRTAETVEFFLAPTLNAGLHTIEALDDESMTGAFEVMFEQRAVYDRAAYDAYLDEGGLLPDPLEAGETDLRLDGLYHARATDLN